MTRDALETSHMHATEEEHIKRRLSPSWIAGGAIAFLILALLVYALLAGPTTPPQVGEPVPNFQLKALDGSLIDLGSQQGKVVVLNVFASWCDPCREEAPALEQAWREYQARGVQFFGIAYKDASSKASAFLDEFDLTYPSAVDPGNRAARSFGVTGVPETFIIDQQGHLVQHFLGAVTQRQLSEALEQLASQ